MVTYSDLFLFCTMVIALVSLCYQVFHDHNDKKK
ncbi:MAG: putative holin-like toxin [Lachnospiraceae bacterium]|nr:putative holin-like toxin [Lachnospiraceae bacterium]